MTNPDPQSKRTKQVFLSYDEGDKTVARQIAEALYNAHINVWFDEWELYYDDSITIRTEEAVAASDVFLVLLSPKSVKSHWVQTELSTFLARELNNRAITLIPILIEECKVPSVFADRLNLDLSKDFESGLARLISQLRSLPEIDFSILDGRTFEKLVSELLQVLGFSIQEEPPTRDSGVDFFASFSSRDPFGAKRREVWLVEVKLYRDQRVSVSALRQMLGYIVMSRGGKGLVVTNGQLTSVAREFLRETAENAGHDLRVIDGTELTNLLMQHPQIVERYFGRRLDYE